VRLFFRFSDVSLTRMIRVYGNPSDGIKYNIIQITAILAYFVSEKK